MTPDFSIFGETPSAPIAIIATPGAEELAQLIDKRLITLFSESHLGKKLHKDTFILKADCPRFTNGDAKGIIYETVRGKDLYIICDPGNHGITYPFFGKEIPVTPDEHFENLKRIICACTGKPARITVIMPMLYGGRQHRRSARESLDCATMLQELQNMGVSDIITFDAHDPRVQNAVPLMGFDNYFAHYQILKRLTKQFPDVKLNKESLMVISPDEGAIPRNVYYASVLGLDLGMFYKRRDYSTVINGRNPIIAHEYIGSSVEGMNVFVADDMIATGDSILHLAKNSKQRAQREFSLRRRFLCSPKASTNSTKRTKTASSTLCFRRTLLIAFPNSKIASGLLKRIFPNIFRISSQPPTSTNPFQIFSTRRRRYANSLQDSATESKGA